jgi:hypothetical protein
MTVEGINAGIRKMKISFLIANAIMYLILIILVISFEAVGDQTKKKEYLCGIEVTEETPVEETDRYIISLVYKIFLIVLAFVISFGFFLYGGYIYHRLKQSKAYVKKKQKGVNKLPIIPSQLMSP